MQAVRPRPGPRNQTLPILQKPFAGEFPLGNFFDHELPFEFTDTNGYQLTWWGERTWGLDGHGGYDWLTPTGTPLLAAAAGEVVHAGPLSPLDCPPLRRTVTDQLAVEVLHDAVQGERFSTVYSHLSRLDVQVGDRVSAGQQLGLSGNTGCSEAPHLHFAVRRWVNTASGRTTLVDPYGWEDTATDPWSQHPEGALSLWLWKDGEAPAVYREARLPPNPTSSDASPVAITVLRWMGWKDDQNPNNEFVQLELDPRFAPSGRFDLTGYAVRNTRFQTLVFPGGSVILQGRPLRLFTGAGSNTETELYWGMAAGAWLNLLDCAHLLRPDVRVMYRMWYPPGGSCEPPSVE